MQAMRVPSASVVVFMWLRFDHVYMTSTPVCLHLVRLVSE